MHYSKITTYHLQTYLLVAIYPFKANCAKTICSCCAAVSKAKRLHSDLNEKSSILCNGYLELLLLVGPTFRIPCAASFCYSRGMMSIVGRDKRFHVADALVCAKKYLRVRRSELSAPQYSDPGGGGRS